MTWDNFVEGLKTAWAWLPQLTGAIGGVLGAAYYVIQLYESRTFQHWKNNWLMKRRARKLARLRARLIVTTAQIKAIEKIRVARREARELVAEASSTAKQVLAEQTTDVEVRDVVDKIMHGDAGTRPDEQTSTI